MLLVMGRPESLPFRSCGVLTFTCVLSMSVDSSCRKRLSEGSWRHSGLHCPSFRGMSGLFSGDSGVERGCCVYTGVNVISLVSIGS